MSTLGQRRRLDLAATTTATLHTVVCTEQVQLHMTANTDNQQTPRWAEEMKSASYRIERSGRTRSNDNKL